MVEEHTIIEEYEMTRHFDTRIVPALVGLIGLAVTLVGCGGGAPEAIAVDSLAQTSVEAVQNTTDSTKPPLTYTVSVSWSTASIEADETASLAFKEIEAYVWDGSEKVASEIFDLTASSHTFTGLEPAQSYTISVLARYADGTYEDGDGASESIRFTGGPWYHDDVTISSGGFRKDTFSSGSFNHIDAYPAGSFQLNDVYYYNTYNSDYAVDGLDNEVWLIVDVNEVTDGNDTDTQRNNINWLSDDVYLLDSRLSGLDDYTDIADVDLEIYTITGEKIFSLTGSATEGTISSTNFTTLLNSVNSGYYAEKEGSFFVRAICTAEPSSYSEDNAEDQYGWWGLAMPGPRVARD